MVRKLQRANVATANGPWVLVVYHDMPTRQSPKASALALLLQAIKADTVVFFAYCDESGIDAKSPFCCVAGYIFDPSQCERFEDEWGRVLEEYGISCFHMADCAHGTGEFSRLTKPQRIELATKCIGIIKRRSRMGVVASVQNSDVLPFKTPNGQDDAYVLCLVWCAGGIDSWARKYAGDRRVSYFFEKGARLQQRASDSIAWGESQGLTGSSYHSHTFIGKPDAHALQAADLLAWEWQAELRNLMGPIKRARRGSLRNLLGMPHIYSHLTQDHIRGLVTGSTDASLQRFNELGPDHRNLIIVRRVPIDADAKRENIEA